MKTLKNVIAVLTLSTIGFAFTSNAAHVDMWDWQVDTAFTAWTPAPPDATVTATNPNAFWGAGSATKLSWGDPVGLEQSSLERTGDNNGAGSTVGMNLANGDLALTSTLVHNNFVINGGSLLGATLSTRLLLDPSPGALPFDVMPAPLAFDINFLETSNDGSCEVPSPVPCNDIFVIDPVANLNQGFWLDGYNYNIEILVEGLGMLSDDACAAAGVAAGCSGFTTVEREVNSFDVNMRITAVPEPSTILLLSLAMFGIVTSIRSKHS
jgi:hypothetical protein